VIDIWIALAVLAAASFHEFGAWKAAAIVAFAFIVMPFRPK
jgi:hypothetical protein